MYKKIKYSISVIIIADFLDSDYTCNDFYVNGISSLNNIQGYPEYPLSTMNKNVISIQ